MNIGVEAASYYIPHLYLEIKELANQRNIDPLKLEKGLGLHKMAMPDVHEDTATMAAEALLKLIQDFKTLYNNKEFLNEIFFEEKNEELKTDLIQALILMRSDINGESEKPINDNHEVNEILLGNINYQIG